MLQQILRDMWVDPALLAELDDDQKQTLFCRMREEQVRRWRLWDQQRDQQPQPSRRTTSKKSVQFLAGADGEPWVWVMGEHPDDMSVEEILGREAHDHAEREAQQLRRSQDELIYCSVDELRAWSGERAQRDALLEISLNKASPGQSPGPVAVTQRVAQWERVLRKRQAEAAREAEEQEEEWRERERRARQAERHIREIARRAREEHRRTSGLELELPQLPQPWFHGLIGRQEAEARLFERPAGAFLVRLSERVRGYAISYRDADRCKHYLVETAAGGYQFLGANQICHQTLGDLVAHHQEHPITLVGGERLLEPCPSQRHNPSLHQLAVSSSQVGQEGIRSIINTDS